MPGSRRASHARGAATALFLALSLAGCQVMAISTVETRRAVSDHVPHRRLACLW